MESYINELLKSKEVASAPNFQFVADNATTPSQELIQNCTGRIARRRRPNRWIGTFKNRSAPSRWETFSPQSNDSGLVCPARSRDSRPHFRRDETGDCLFLSEPPNPRPRHGFMHRRETSDIPRTQPNLHPPTAPTRSLQSSSKSANRLCPRVGRKHQMPILEPPFHQTRSSMMSPLQIV